MSWRFLMGVENEYFNMYPQKEQKEQKVDQEESFATIATIADKNKKLNMDDPEIRFDLNEHCQDCSYHDTGPTPDCKGIIHWCGPFKEPGCIHWLNIAELTACPKGNWADVSKTVH
jgi:hypothetical protein